jgi:hypothetical protein
MSSAPAYVETPNRSRFTYFACDNNRILGLASELPPCGLSCQRSVDDPRGMIYGAWSLKWHHPCPRSGLRDTQTHMPSHLFFFFLLVAIQTDHPWVGHQFHVHVLLSFSVCVIVHRTDSITLDHVVNSIQRGAYYVIPGLVSDLSSSAFSFLFFFFFFASEPELTMVYLEGLMMRR